MKLWQGILLGVFFGLLSGALILVINNRPTGQAIELPPLPTAAPLVVHISGAVTNAGVYALPGGSRLEDAVRAAGGFSADADPRQINLAARIADGEKITIPSISPTSAPGAPAPDTRSPALPLNGTPARVNLNTATLEELDALPGIGETKAAQIIAYREENGPFASIEDIQNVPGIGPKIFETIQDLISIY
ncbi:MAG TPA: ComEA family DNA-binding protein [Anaerolineaceae bacterium]